jgi:preprotein translocase subunit SecA
MLDMVNTEVTKILMTVQFRSEAELPKVEEPQAPQNVQYHHADYEQALEEANADTQAEPSAQTFVRQGQKVGRNDPCPCGSGKKYKQCHGRLT